MGRPRTPIGTFGEISFVKVAGGQVQARTRFRDDDGQVRRVSAAGVSRKEAERNLKKVLAHRASHVASGEITADSSFAKLVAVWLADLDLENKLAPSTRALYERNMRQLVMPAFEHYGGLNRSSQHPYRYEVLWMWSKKELIEKQARFWLVIAGGSTLQAACDAVRVDRRTGRRWRQATGGQVPRKKPEPSGQSLSVNHG